MDGTICLQRLTQRAAPTCTLQRERRTGRRRWWDDEAALGCLTPNQRDGGHDGAIVPYADVSTLKVTGSVMLQVQRAARPDRCLAYLRDSRGIAHIGTASAIDCPSFRETVINIITFTTTYENQSQPC